MQPNLTTNMIEYKDIEDFPGYRIGNDGSVWSCLKKIAIGGGFEYVVSCDWVRMHPRLGNRGYLRAHFRKNGSNFNKSVHVLVLEGFHGPRPTSELGRHLDGNKLNNNFNNLAWGTRSDNYWDARRLGTAFVPSGGENHPSSILRASTVRDIHRAKMSGCTVKIIAEQFNVKSSSVYEILAGRRWHDIFEEMTGSAAPPKRRVSPPQY